MVLSARSPLMKSLIEIPDEKIMADCRQLIIDHYTAIAIELAKDHFKRADTREQCGAGYTLVKEVMELKIASPRTKEAVSNTIDLLTTHRFQSFMEPLVIDELNLSIKNVLKTIDLDALVMSTLTEILPEYIKNRVERELDKIDTNSLDTVKEIVSDNN